MDSPTPLGTVIFGFLFNSGWQSGMLSAVWDKEGAHAGVLRCEHLCQIPPSQPHLVAACAEPAECNLAKSLSFVLSTAWGCCLPGAVRMCSQW